jgi:hypothetical protein
VKTDTVVGAEEGILVHTAHGAAAVGTAAAGLVQQARPTQLAAEVRLSVVAGCEAGQAQSFIVRRIASVWSKR